MTCAMIARESTLLQGLLQPKRNPLKWIFHLETRSLLRIHTWTISNLLQDLLTSIHSAEVDVVIFNLHFVIFCLVILYHYLLYSHHTITCKVNGWSMLARCLPDRLSCLCWLSVRQSYLGCIVLHLDDITIRVRTLFRFSTRLCLFPTTIQSNKVRHTTLTYSTL